MEQFSPGPSWVSHHGVDLLERHFATAQLPDQMARANPVTCVVAVTRDRIHAAGLQQLLRVVQSQRANTQIGSFGKLPSGDVFQVTSFSVMNFLPGVESERA